MRVKNQCKNKNKKKKVLSLHSLHGLHGLRFGVTAFSRTVFRAVPQLAEPLEEANN